MNIVSALDYLIRMSVNQNFFVVSWKRFYAHDVMCTIHFFGVYLHQPKNYNMSFLKYLNEIVFLLAISLFSYDVL